MTGSCLVCTCAGRRLSTRLAPVRIPLIRSRPPSKPQPHFLSVSRFAVRRALGVSDRFHSICVLRALFELITDQEVLRFRLRSSLRVSPQSSQCVLRAQAFTDSLLDADCLIDVLDNHRTEAKDNHTALLLKVFARSLNG